MDTVTAQKYADAINKIANETTNKHAILANETRIVEIFMKTNEWLCRKTEWKKNGSNERVVRTEVAFWDDSELPLTAKSRNY